MKIATMILAGAATLAMAQAAQAAPKVSGKYAYTSTGMCQALISQNKNGTGAVTSVNPANGGTITSEVGYITFPAAASSSGNATVTGRGFEGNAVRISPNSTAPTGNVLAINNNLSGTFSLTETTFTIAGQTFLMSYGNVVSGVARTIHLVQKETTRCINTITATKKP